MVGRSKVWRLSHFANPERTEVQCDVCPTKIKFVGNTTNIARHLELKHPVEYASLTATVQNGSQNGTNTPEATVFHSLHQLAEDRKSKADENVAIRRILQIHNKELQKLKSENRLKSASVLPDSLGLSDTKHLLWSWHCPTNDGSEDGKLSSLIGGTSSNEMNDNSIESMDNNDVIDDHPLPPSPEQFLTEVEEASNHNSSMIPLRPESYKLRHNNHLNIVLESLADDESFMDVTLTAQGQSVKAHKSVLSAVSPYFKGVLKQNPCQHPIIIMPRDINFEELNSIIGYIYRGEITIAAEELPSLLKTAELLQVSGLSTSEASAVGGLAAGLLGRVQSTNLASSNQSSVKTKSTKRSKAVSKTKKEIVAPPEPEQVNPVDFLTQDMAFVKEEIKTEPEELELSAPNNEENLTQKSTDGNGSKFMDIIQSFSDLKNAPPSSSENYTISPYKCPYCVEIKRPLEALETHMSTKHPSKPSFICKICFKVFVKQLLFQTHLKICKNQK